jgi:putative adhesin
MNMHTLHSEISVAAVYDRRISPVAAALWATRIGCTPALRIAKRLQNKCDGHRPPLQILFFSLGILFLLLGSFSVSALTEENVNITRDAKSGGKLIVEVDFGTIEVAPGDNDKVVVNASRKISASSKDKEAEYYASAPITVTGDGTTVVVRARRGKDWEDDGQICNNDARYSIHVPSTFDAELKTEGGAITTTNLTGKVKAHTSGGDMKFSLLHGPIKADTDGGEIEVSGCEGKIEIETSGGQIEAIGGSGTLRASTAGGTIKVENFNGDASVETSGGQLALANIRGKLDAETAGGFISAKIPSPVPGDVRLETAAGAIEVVVPSDAALTIDAETGIGGVRSDLPIASRTRGDSEGIKGTINGGGKSLHLRSGAGSISIKSRADSAQNNSRQQRVFQNA